MKDSAARARLALKPFARFEVISSERKRTTTRAYLLDALAGPRRLDFAGQRRELANPELAEHSRVKQIYSDIGR
jgi:hypothetical protein